MAAPLADAPLSRVATEPPVRRNVLANYAGSGWVAIVSLVVVPMYIKYLGAEAYGLVGFFITIQALLVLLDMGLSAIANREAARRTASGDMPGLRDLLATLEVVFWVVAVAIAVGVFAAADAVAAHWLQSSRLSPALVSSAVALIGAAIAAQWPGSLYTGALLGLQRHVALNALVAGFTSLRAFGALGVLVLVRPSITAFFVWHILAALAQTLAMRAVVWRLMRGTNVRPRIRWRLIRQQGRFAAGVTGAYALTLVLTQLDKLLLSRLLSLESFGYYTLAAVVAMTLYRLVGPVSHAVYPRLTQLASDPQRTAELRALYHRSSQAIAALTLPAAVVVSAFARELLLLWTRDPAIASHTHRLLSLLVVGMAFYGMAALPYALQLASGWTRFGFVTNAFAVVLLIPAMIVGVRLRGAEGAALAWVATTLAYALAHVYFTHRYVLAGELGFWARTSFLAPAAGTMAIVILARAALPTALGGWQLILALCGIASATVLTSIALMPDLRRLTYRAVGIGARG